MPKLSRHTPVLLLVCAFYLSTGMNAIALERDDNTGSGDENPGVCNTTVYTHATPSLPTNVLFELEDAVCGTSYQLGAPPGNGSWSGQPPGSTYSPDPTDPNAIITIPGNGGVTYTFYWIVPTIDPACPDFGTIDVTFNSIPVADAGIDRTICGLSDSLHADNPTSFGSGWIVLPGTSIDGETFPAGLVNVLNPSVTVDVPGEYTFQWVEFNGDCRDTADVTLTFVDALIADAGNDTIFCGINGQLAANGVEGDGDWDIISGVMNFAGNNQDDPDVMVNVLTTPATVVLEWELDLNGCLSQDTITVFFQDAPDSDAGPDDHACGTEYELAAVPSTGLGSWSPPDGIDDPTDPNATLTYTEEGPVTLTWTESIGMDCVDSDEVTITFYEQPIADAGEDFIACGNTVQLDATPSGFDAFWFGPAGVSTFVGGDNQSPDAMAIVDPIGVYKFRWNIFNGPCADEDTVQIEFVVAPSPVLGNDTLICGTSLPLSVENSTAPGSWTATPALTFSPADGTTTNVSGATPGTYTIIWTETAGECEGVDSVEIEFIEQPIANAGVDTTVCNSMYLLGAGPTIGSGEWTCDDPYLIIDEPTQSSTGISGPNNVYTLVWTVENGPCQDVDSAIITLDSPEMVSAGETDISCGLEYTLAASPAIGQWTIPAGVSIDDATDATATVTATSPGEQTFIWTAGSPTCSVSDEVTIDFVDSPTAFAGQDNSVCGFSAILDPTPSVGNGEWTSTSVVQFVDLLDPNTEAFITQPTQFGTYELYWTEENGGCTDVDTVLLTFLDSPIAEAGMDATVCGPNAVLSASLTTGTGEWIDLPSGTISDPFSPSTTFQSDEFGPQTFVWEESSTSCSTIDSVTITFLEIPDPMAGEDMDFCGLSGAVTAAAPIDEGAWSSPDPIVFSDQLSTNTSVSVDSYGSYSCVWTETNQDLCARRDTVVLAFFEQPEASAGENDEICGTEYVLSASASIGTGTWTSVGGGDFLPDENEADATVSIPDLGTYTLVWTVENGICTDSDEVTIVFNGIPETSAVDILCINGNTEYQVAFDITGGEASSYEVTGDAGTLGSADFLSDPIPNGEEYEFILSDANDCGNVVINGEMFCESLSDAGAMDLDTIHGCVGTSVAAMYLGGENLDPNDAQVFILHDSPGAPLDNIVQSNASPDFDFIAGMMTETVYYISSVVGTEDGGGTVDFDAFGVSVSSGTPVIFHDPPTAVSTLEQVDLCVGDTVGVGVILNGSAPFSLEYTLVGESFTEATALSDVVIEVTGTGALVLEGLTDAYCQTDLELTIDLIAHAIPALTMDDTLRTCSGAPDDIVADLSGEGPWTFDLFIDGSYESTITTGDAQTSVPVTGDGQYTISSLSDAFCTSDEDVTIGVDVVLTPPFGLAGEDVSYCTGDPIQIGIPTISGFDYLWTQSVDLDDPFSASPAVLVSNPTAEPISMTYQLTTTNDICSTDDEVMVTVLPLPLDYGINGPDSICEGDIAVLEAFGGSEYAWTPHLSLSDNSVADPTISPTASITYHLEITNIYGCSVDTSEYVEVNPLPQVSFLPDITSGCKPLIVEWTNLTPAPFLGSCSWSTNGGTIISSDCESLQIRYDTPGDYYADLEVISPQGCVSSAGSPDTIGVIGIFAGLVFQPAEPTIDDPWVQAFDTSTPSPISWFWTLDGDTTSFTSDPLIDLDSLPVGEYDLCLMVMSPEGCRDTLCRVIDLRTNFQLWVPTAFTPDANFLNDVFKPVINHPEELALYEFRVFDRRGHIKFETSDPRSGWDGINVRENGILQGLYQWEVVYRTKTEFKFKKIKGFVELSK